MLLPSIVPREPSNLLFKPFGNYGKLRKGKPRATLMFCGLGDSDYITDQSRSQSASAMNKSNANGMESSWRNQMQKSLYIVRE